MRLATPIAFVFLCVLCAAGCASPAVSPALARDTPAPSPAASRPAADDDDAAVPAARGAPAQQAGRERRRHSYASCNRDSHRRNLRGGARRRFLIRCKLGYERRQPQSAQGKRP